ncbi:hypothetical protein JCM19233_2928 [Vibrio astriarenae]|nr:hypothetical protein JCM19233_2928 [Vibrio sp. C7]
MMGVDREYRRRGIATEFMQMMLEKVIPATGQSRAQASLYMTSQHMMKLLRTAGFKKSEKATREAKSVA